MNRVYLDWNASAPLRPEARAAMIAAMDVVGNPSSVHGEGRAAKAIVEKARGQVSALVGCERDEVVFTSGATEAAAILLDAGVPSYASPAAHECITSLADELGLLVNSNGHLNAGVADAIFAKENKARQHHILAHSFANSETGVIDSGMIRRAVLDNNISFLSDITQGVHRVQFNFKDVWNSYAVMSSHKIGGPTGVGAAIIKNGRPAERLDSALSGGGQEKGRRSGTENVIGIAGMGTAAEAAQRDLDNGVWEQVAEFRDAFEAQILNEAPDVIVFCKEVERLPNTSYFAVPGWKGETQVMQMDLAGYAVSAGSACSSGKTKASRVLKAMGFDDLTASSALRVSIGPTTTKQELDGFATAWLNEYRRFKARAA